MNLLKQIKFVLFLAIAASFALTGCKKAPAAQNLWVGFHFHTFIGGNLVDPIDYPTQYFDDSMNRYEHLSIAQFYITNISVHLYGTNTWAPLTGVVMLKRIDNEVYPLGQIPSANYDSVKFTVGLGSALNSQAPTAFSTSGIDSVLSATESGRMWGSNTLGTSATTGYTFMNIQGYDSTDLLPFSYQIGGLGDTANVVLVQPGGFNFEPNGTSGQLNLIHIIADYGKLLQAIPTMNSGNTNSTFYGPNPSPSNTLLQNIKNMFRWECSPPINC